MRTLTVNDGTVLGGIGLALVFAASGNSALAQDLDERVPAAATSNHPIDPDTLLPLLRDPSAEVRASAAVARRIAVRAACELPHPKTAKLLEPFCFDRDIASALRGSETVARAFAALPLLADDDPRVLARGAIAVRTQLKVDAPIAVLKRIVADLNPIIRDAAWSVRSEANRSRTVPPIPVAAVPLWLDAIAHDVMPGPIRGEELSTQARSELFDALIEAGHRAGDEVSPRDRAGRYQRCSQWYAAAAGIGSDEVRRLLLLAVKTQDGGLAAQLLATLYQRRIELDESCAQVLEQLLDHPDLEIGELTALLVEQLLSKHRAVELRARVFARATEVAGDLTALRLRHDRFYVQGRPWLYPSGRDTQLFFTAARFGHAALLEPLLVDLELGIRRPPHLNRESSHLFGLMCLRYLAVHADAEQARRLHTLLSPRYGRSLGSEGDVEVSLIASVLHALYAAAPDDLLPWYEPLLADNGTCSVMCRELADQVDAIPEPRLRTFLRATEGRQLPTTPLLIRFPESLVSDWLAGERRGQHAVICCAWWIHREPSRVLALVERGALPRELIAAACASWSLPLPLTVLAEILPAEANAPETWVAGFAKAIGSATRTTESRDFAALARLSASRVSDVALAAAKSAARIGDEGKKLTCAVITRLLDDGNDEVAARALQIAVATGIDTANRAEAVARLKNAANPITTIATEAAEMRFGGLDPAQCESPTFWYSISLAKVDVRADTLRARLGENPAGELRNLLIDCSTITCVNALRVTSGLEVWSVDLEHAVLEQTLAYDPSIRLAAYEALATRDPELWPCALLVHEAALDPDPRVQEVARRAAANGQRR